MRGAVPVTIAASDDSGVAWVELWVDGVWFGSDVAAPWSVSWNTSAGADGAHSLVAKAFDLAGKEGASVPVAVTVVNSSAAYDSTRRAPRCNSAFVGVCDSSTLLNGRGPIGPEPNQPNTLGGSCADGTSGKYHSNESLDRLRISRSGGGSFSPGATVTVEATVWVNNRSSDRLDLYYAANAASPVWQLIATLTPPGTGQRTLSASYVLPAGSEQSIRGRFRRNGSPAPCGTGTYDDHDDLVFSVTSP
ncbi:MAG: Ig-like domain-containing protein [Myxococcales bacterium]